MSSEEQVSQITELISTTFSDYPESMLENIPKHLANMCSRGLSVDEVFAIYKDKAEAMLKRTDNLEVAYRTALKNTGRAVQRSGRTSAKPHVGFIVGVEHRENDMQGMRYKQLRDKYTELEQQGKAEDVEINREEYNTIFAEYNRLSKADEEKARSFMKSSLEGRFTIVTLDGEEIVVEDFIDDMSNWASGAVNLGYGKIVRSNPTVVVDFLVMGDKKEVVSINVKGREALEVLYKAPLFHPVMITAVKNANEGQKWYIDQSFSIKEVSYADALNAKDETTAKKKMLKFLQTTLPKTLQVGVNKIDDWQRKLAKKDDKAKYGKIALVKGIVDDIYYRDNGTATIVLVDDDIDLDDFSWDDEDSDDIKLRISCNERMTSKIDFDVDTVLYVYGQVYRGNKWDSVAREVVVDGEGNPLPADLPSCNAWGFIADPDLVNSKIQPKSVSLSDYDTEDDDSSEEGFDDFEIEGDE